jgi:hypothetical protein
MVELGPSGGWSTELKDYRQQNCEYGNETSGHEFPPSEATSAY